MPQRYALKLSHFVLDKIAEFRFRFSLFVVSFFFIQYLQAVSVLIHSHHPAKSGVQPRFLQGGIVYTHN